jgi:hypothetical protein
MVAARLPSPGRRQAPGLIVELDAFHSILNRRTESRQLSSIIFARAPLKVELFSEFLAEC